MVEVESEARIWPWRLSLDAGGTMEAFKEPGDQKADVSWETCGVSHMKRLRTFRDRLAEHEAMAAKIESGRYPEFAEMVVDGYFFVKWAVENTSAFSELLTVEVKPKVRISSEVTEPVYFLFDGAQSGAVRGQRSKLLYIYAYANWCAKSPQQFSDWYVRNGLHGAYSIAKAWAKRMKEDADNAGDEPQDVAGDYLVGQEWVEQLPRLQRARLDAAINAGEIGDAPAGDEDRSRKILLFPAIKGKIKAPLAMSEREAAKIIAAYGLDQDAAY